MLGRGPHRRDRAPSSPVQRSIWSAAWCTSIPSPSTTVAPWSRAPRSSGVSSGWYTRSATTWPGVERGRGHRAARPGRVAGHADRGGVHDEGRRGARPSARSAQGAVVAARRARPRPRPRRAGGRTPRRRAPARPSASATARRRAAGAEHEHRRARPGRDPPRAATAGIPRRRSSRRRAGRRRSSETVLTLCSAAASADSSSQRVGRRGLVRHRHRQPGQPEHAHRVERAARRAVGHLERDVDPVEPERPVRGVVQHGRERVPDRITDDAGDPRRAGDRRPEIVKMRRSVFAIAMFAFCCSSVVANAVLPFLSITT